MTLIVAIRDDSNPNLIWLAADQMTTRSGVSRIETATPKIISFANPDFYLGISGSYRVRNVIEHIFVPPMQTVGSDMEYMVSEFIPTLIEVSKESFIIESVDGKYELNLFMLVIYRGNVYYIGPDLAVVPQDNRTFMAAGSGEDLAEVANTALLPYLKARDRIPQIFAAVAASDSRVSLTFTCKGITHEGQRLSEVT